MLACRRWNKPIHLPTTTRAVALQINPHQPKTQPDPTKLLCFHWALVCVRPNMVGTQKNMWGVWFHKNRGCRSKRVKCIPSTELLVDRQRTAPEFLLGAPAARIPARSAVVQVVVTVRNGGGAGDISLQARVAREYRVPSLVQVSQLL